MADITTFGFRQVRSPGHFSKEGMTSSWFPLPLPQAVHHRRRPRDEADVHAKFGRGVLRGQIRGAVAAAEG